MTTTMMDLGATYVAATSRLDRLSRRERQVLHQIAMGQSNAGIAAQLCLSRKTVEALCSHIFDKLELEPSQHLNRRVLAVLTLLQARTRRAAD
ncbi:LuxR C-terminal-related transcriptional regulator [Nocardioides sp. WS12]|uniref:response regulator transcription factor n=1 Tax=Nocardioides sp. WS12 TaxID=2486272 RepID=UPI0015FBD7DB|nr:LuxR C-terminal-related transcriptional regulator [Nocardioides sp. WS12]